MPNLKGIFSRGRDAWPRGLEIGLLVALASAPLLVGCSTSDLLSVQVPNSVNAKLFDDPANAGLMVTSVIGDFECAFGGFVVTEALLSDELHDASYSNGNWNVDRRDDDFTSGTYGTASCTSQTGLYTPLSTAREEADAAIRRLNGWTDAQVPARTSLIAQANLYAGFSYAALGMSMCQAAFDLGPLVDQKGMFALAEARFSAAITAAQSSGQNNVLNAAYVGRARMRLFQHNAQAAISDAQQVPPGFVFNASRDQTDSRRFNQIFQSILTAGTATVEVSSRALMTENGQIDPRSATIMLKTPPSDGLATIYIPTKYEAASLTAGESIPIPIASYAEAQLILAEAEGGSSAVSIINNMRAAVGLQPYTGATDTQSITNLIASERQRVLFFDGFRAFDIERFNLTLIPPIGSPYLQGGVYGATVCFPVPDIERYNNPQIVVSELVSGVQGQTPIP